MRFSARRLGLSILAMAAAASQVAAVEKASDQVSAFYGSFSQALPIQVPPYHGLEPRLSLAYSSEGRNGFVGVGWSLTGFSTIERANAGRGTPNFNSADIFLLDGQELVPCQAGSVSPSCTTGGTHSTKQESYLKIKFDSAANTWTIWGKDGTRTVLTSILTVPPNAVVTGGTLVWGQTSMVDTHSNTVTYAWVCTGGDCYPDTASYNGYQVKFYRESRTDTLSRAAASTLRTTLYRLRSVLVQLGSTPIRGYKLTYTSSALTGRSLLSSVQMYGKDLVQDGSGLITGGTSLPAQAFTYQNDAIGKSFASWAFPPTGNTTEAVTWANRVNVAPAGSGNGITKNAGVNGNWDAGATSTRALASGSGYLQFTATNVFDALGNGIGLSNGNTDTNWTDVDFGLYLYNTQVYVIESGTQPTHVAVAEGDTLRVEVTASSVTYTKNGTAFYTHAATPVYPLLVDSSMRTTNTTLSNAFISGNLAYANAWCQGSTFLTGDFNGDGRTDQLCGSYSVSNGQSVNPRIEVALANGSGFASPALWSSALTLTPGRVTAGDFNNDGKTDLAVQSPDAVISVMLSNGAAFAAPAAWGTAVGPRPSGGQSACNGSEWVTLGTGDFNGDGVTDVSCKRLDDTAVHIGLSNGTSAFGFSVWADSACDVYNRVDSSLDVDGDGKDDWYCIGATNGVLAVLVSSGSAFYGGIAGNLSGSFCPSDYYVLGDLNGDGRTDAYCTLNGRVSLSLGRAWAAATADLPPWCTATGVDVFAADVDGDGASEIVCNNNGNGTDDIQVRKFKGGAMAAVETWKASWCTGKVRAGDWNGDGKTDLYCDSVADPAVAGTAAFQSDLMASAGTGLGGTVSAVYAPATSFSNTNSVPARWAVTSLTTDDGRGGVATTTFSYQGGLMDRKERLFLGFAYAKQTLPCIAGEAACPYNELWFRQDLPAAGKPSKIVQRDGANAFQGVSTFDYVTNGTAVPRTSLLSGERKVSFSGAGCPTWPCASSKQTYTTHQYDGYGNETTTTFYGDEGVTGDESSSVTTYTPNAGLYIVGVPATLQRLGPTGAVLAQGQFWYDGASSTAQAPTKGDLTTLRSWLDTESRWVATVMQYDTWGNPTVVTDPTSRSITTGYDTTYHVFPTSVTNGASEANSARWDEICGTPFQRTDANLQVTTFQTDALCRPSSTDYPLGHHEEWAYLQLGTASQQRTVYAIPAADGHGGMAQSITYLDGLGRPYREQRALSSQPIVSRVRRDTAYNARGGVASSTAPYANTDPVQTTSFSYDSLGRVTAALLPDTNSRTSSYGIWSVTQSDEHGHPATTTYDGYARAIASTQVIDGQAVTTTTEYDALGRTTAVQDALGIRWTWTYDSLSRVVTRTDPDSGTWSFTYDDAGRVLTQTDAKGQSMTFGYDAAGRQTSKIVGPIGLPVVTTTMTYSQARAGYFNVGRLTSVVGPGSGTPESTFTLDYDAAGRNVHHVRTLSGVPYELTRRYDAAGRLKGTTYPDGDVVGSDLDPLQYDGFGRLASIPGIVSSFSYDASSRPVSQLNVNQTSTTRTFSLARGFLTHIDSTGPSGIIQSLDYGRDAFGLATNVASTFPNESWNYLYDDAHRLTAAIAGYPPSPALNESFTYDVAGRMTFNERVGIYNYPIGGSPRPHAPTSAGPHGLTYDGNGNLLTGAGRSFTWNADNLPDSVTTASGTTSFAYDGMGSRIRKTYGSNTTLYPFGDDYEINGGLVTKYISGGSGLIAKRTGTQTFWLHSDALGSIAAITDLTGAVVQRRSYFPYGDKLADTTGFVESRGYIDQRQDPETGLTYLHARYYDPALGFFMSADPAHPLAPGVGLARYTYALGDPVNGSDRSGLDDCYALQVEGHWQCVPVFPHSSSEFQSGAFQGSYLSQTIRAQILDAIRAAEEMMAMYNNRTQAPSGPTCGLFGICGTQPPGSGGGPGGGQITVPFNPCPQGNCSTGGDDPNTGGPTTGGGPTGGGPGNPAPTPTPAPKSFWRRLIDPDYFQIEGTVPVPIKESAGIVGISPHFTVDRHGTAYLGVGPSVGKTGPDFPWSASAMFGYATIYPGATLEDFLSGWGANPYSFGAGPTFGVGMNKSGMAFQAGGGTPQWGSGFSYSWVVYRRPVQGPAGGGW